MSTWWQTGSSQKEGRGLLEHSRSEPSDLSSTQSAFNQIATSINTRKGTVSGHIGMGLYVTKDGKRPQSRVGCLVAAKCLTARSALPHTLDPRSLTLTALTEVTKIKTV